MGEAEAILLSNPVYQLRGMVALSYILLYEILD